MEAENEPAIKALTSNEFKANLYSEPDNFEGEIINVIHEFLLKNGFFKALEALEYEILNKEEAYMKNPENLNFCELLLLEVN